MCGIFVYCGKPCDVDKLKNCFNLTKHRGPDNSQFHVYYEDNTKMIAFGFHRLSINGMKRVDNQPFIQNGVFAMCNGEIWNHKEMKAEINKLKDVSFEGQSDCNGIIPYYKLFGFSNLCTSIDGVFSIALYDSQMKEIYIGRDPLGIRSLYYAQDSENNFYLSSELKSIPTEFSNVKQFPPGNFTTVSTNLKNNDIISFHQFYDSNLYPLNFNSSFKEQEEIYKNLIHDVLTKAVTKRFMTERNYGCVLSGGLDSTIITAIVSKLTNQPINTYTIGLEGAEDFKWAKLASEYLGTNHHEFIVTEEEFLEAIPDVIYQIESFDVTTVRASVGNWLLAKKIKELNKDTVIFCGDVADELFGGYRGFGLTTSEEEFHSENIKMLYNIHFFDVLRSEKSFAGHGLEGRVPFGDLDFIKLVSSIPSKFKMWNGNDKNLEKKLLRLAFEDYLPESLLWRRKEAFSDGVSSKKRSWFYVIQEHLSTKYNDLMTTIFNNSHMSPYNLESIYYRKIFETYFKSVESIPYFWKHPFTSERDPSARCLQNYTSEITSKKLEKMSLE